MRFAPFSTRIGTFSSSLEAISMSRSHSVLMTSGPTFPIASIKDCSKVVIAAVNSTAPFAMTIAKSIRPCAKAAIMVGISEMMVVSAILIASEPSTAAPVRARNPAANIAIPAPAKKAPVPISMIAAPRSKNPTEAGINNSPPTARIASDAPSMARPRPIASQLIVPKRANAGASIINPTDTASSATPPRATKGMPIRAIAPARMASDPPSMTSDRPISSHDIVAKIFIAPVRMVIATAIASIVAAPTGAILSVDRIATAPTRRPIAPPMATIDLPMSSQDIVANTLNAPLMIVRAEATITIAAAPATLPWISFAPTASAARPPPRTTKARPISSQDIDPIIFSAAAMITRAVAMRIIPPAD